MTKLDRATMDAGLERSLIHLLHRCSQAAEDSFARTVASADVTARQFAVLSVVAHDPNVSQTDIVYATGVDRSTLADIVKRMVAKGLLSRRRTREDARAYAIRITPKGTALLEEIGDRAARAEELLLETLSPRDRTQLVDLLRQLAAAADRRAEREADARERAQNGTDELMLKSRTV